MTQRIFDIENKQDMQDLWDILPDEVNKIEKYPDGVIDPFAGFCVPSTHIPCRSLIKINWHDKKEITRPIPEVTLDDIGKLCLFWNDDIEKGRIAIFANTSNRFNYGYTFCDNTDTYWKHCRRLTKQEIEELC